jgi:MYXO-CTERM domain-containing protein
MRTCFFAALLMAIPLSASAYVGYDDESEPMYGWSDTEHPEDGDSPEFVWDSIAGSGTTISFRMGETQGPFDIGFDFEYYGEIYDQVYISAYGLLGFSTLSSTWSLVEFPNVGMPNNMIGSWMTNCDTWSSTGYYDTVGAAGSETFVFEFNCISWSGGGQNTQIVLEEGSNDIFVYVDSSTVSPWGGGMQSIGMENDTGDLGLSAYYSMPGLSEYAAFFSPNLERPSIRVETDELVVDEGGSLDVQVQVRDRIDGSSQPCAACTLAWDLDLDGEFDDGDSDTVTISAANADGPSELSVMVRATDVDANVTDRTITIDVRNLPPVITPPETETVLRNTEWNYDPHITDPCPLDTWTPVVDERPTGMTVLPGGALRWTPTSEDVGEHTVRIIAYDDDDDPDVEGDGDATLEFTLTVTNNTAPSPPNIIEPANGSTVDTLTPTFIVQTPIDAEGDSLTIRYDIDTADTYTTPGHPTGEIPATLGQTGWTLSDAQALTDGERYYVRVKAWDGHDESFAKVSRFSVDLGGESDGGPDGGPDGGDEDGGVHEPEVESCNCSATSPAAAGGPLALAMIVAGLFVSMRRARRS